jgi:hypothetical protein
MLHLSRWMGLHWIFNVPCRHVISDSIAGPTSFGAAARCADMPIQVQRHRRH